MSDIQRKQYVYYKKSDNTFRICDTNTMKVKTVDTLPRNSKLFHVLKGFSASKSGLKEFATTFKVWCEQLSSEEIPIDYGNYLIHWDMNTWISVSTVGWFSAARREHMIVIHTISQDFTPKCWLDS